MKEILEIANVYAEGYVPMFRKAVRQAFLAGITFGSMMSKGDITKDMICGEFFVILDNEVKKLEDKIKQGKA